MITWLGQNEEYGDLKDLRDHRDHRENKVPKVREAHKVSKDPREKKETPGEGSVNSVNGHLGPDVQLSAEDVGAPTSENFNQLQTSFNEHKADYAQQRKR